MLSKRASKTDVAKEKASIEAESRTETVSARNGKLSVRSDIMVLVPLFTLFPLQRMLKLRRSS